MALSKNGVNGVGAAACVALIVVGGLFVAKPQFGAASDYAADKTEAAGGRQAQDLKLASLKAQKPKLAELQAEYEEAKAGIPESDDIASIGKLIVEKLPEGVVLTSFSYQPMSPFVIPVPPVATLVVPPAPPAEVAPATGPTSGPPVLQQIPLTIKVEGVDKDTVAEYVDALSTGPRLLYVYLIQSNPLVGLDTDTAAVSADYNETTIYAYAYANAPAAAPVAPPGDAAAAQ